MKVSSITKGPLYEGCQYHRGFVIYRLPLSQKVRYMKVASITKGSLYEGCPVTEENQIVETGVCAIGRAAFLKPLVPILWELHLSYFPGRVAKKERIQWSQVSL
jgi:hypothetical protein